MLSARGSKALRIIPLVLVMASILVSTPLPSFADVSLADDHVYFGGPMPSQYKFAKFWAESNTNSPPFSESPWDGRNSDTNRQMLSGGFQTVLGLCQQSDEVGCISSIDYSLDGGITYKSAQLLQSPGQRSFAGVRLTEQGTWDVINTSTYPADPSTGFFKAVLPNFWRLSGATNSVGDSYMINVVANSYISNGKAKLNGIDFLVNAGKASPFSLQCSYWGVQTNKMDFLGSSAPDGYCFEPVNIPANLKLRISVNLGARIAELSGWFDGRLSDPTIDFGLKTPGVITVEGTALPVDYVQTLDISKGDPLYDVSPLVEKVQGLIGTRGIETPRSGLGNFIKYASAMPVNASARNNVWRMTSWSSNGIGNGCQSLPGVKGIVITNSTAYDADPPSIDSQTGSLNFRVASSHFNPDGSVNQGYYQLLIQQSLAKCLWGNISGSALISVIDEDGSQNAATTTMGVSDGWVHFSATGFHYSAPQISVRIKDDTSPKASTSLSQPRHKNVSITCIKGKLTKRIAGAAPKCPTGWKKI